VDDEIRESLYNGLFTFFPKNITYEEFIKGSDDKQIGIMSSIKVGPTIADDIKKNSFLAVLGSLIVVFLYILLRFRKWQYSLGAVAAVFHDVMIVLSIFSIAYTFMPFNMEINQAFIAAVLTVIGYSLNDTVVVFDRIREFTKIHISWEKTKTVNGALNSTLSRTINTSLTTLVVLFAIFIFGGEAIRGFMFALIVGVLVGTYSSLFIATPVMFDTSKNLKK
jgi:SecD/SecF fusion protein